MTILVLGYHGQLAAHLRELCPGALCWGREQLNLEDTAAIGRRVRDVAPQLIINAAAYTAVDRAESQPDVAWRINCEAPAALAQVASALGIPVIQISTDYVFDGNAASPYRPDDAVHPLNVYGRSKLAGELAVATLTARYWILRASWVFSEYGHNFVRTMLRLARERGEISVVADQYGRPTYAGDLARLTASLVDSVLSRGSPAPGIYHVGGGPVITWHKFAEMIADRAFALGLLPIVPRFRPITTTEYATPAIRPLRAILAPSDEFQRGLGVVPDWESHLDQVVQRLW